MGKRKHESQQATSEVINNESKGSSKKARQSATSQPSVGQVDPVICVAGNFQAIPIQLQAASSKSKPGPVHYIYSRPHSSTSASSGSNSLPADRTLFVANLPIDTTSQHLKSFFSKAGVIERVKLQLARNVGWVQKEEGEQEEEEEEDEEEEEEIEADQPGLGKGGKNRKKNGKNSSKKKAGPPKIIPLPSLDPRSSAGGNPFLPTSSSAHIIFLDSSSMTRCLDLIQSNDLPKTWKDPREGVNKVRKDQLNQESEESSLNQPRKKIRTADEILNYHSNKTGQSVIPPLGLEFFLQDFRSKRPSLQAIKTYADATIENYEWKRANPTKAGIVGSRIPGVSIGPNGELLDADGFTIVQSGGKYGKAKGGEGTNVGMLRNRKTKDDLSEASRNRKKKTKELEDFYRFQMREKKREQLAQLRAQFEADKEKVKKLKASRSFKPF